MRLIDLEPRWFDVPGVGGAIDGVTFLCPHCRTVRLGIQFTPIGVDRVVAAMTLEEKLRHVHELRTFDVPPGTIWDRTGETFDTLTLSPSVDASASGHWHGHIEKGQIK